MSRLIFPVIMVFLYVSGYAQASTPENAIDKFSCEVSGNYVVVKFKNSKVKKERNPKYFGVSFGDDFIYVNYPDAHANFTNYNIYSKTLKLNIKSQHGIKYVNGVASNVLVFSKPGIYNLFFMDNIETEPENTFSLQCSVKLDD